MKVNKTTPKALWRDKRLIIPLAVFLAIALVVPLVLSFTMHVDLLSKALGDANGWLGFWGGYLGAIIGAITVAVVTSIQMRVQRELHRETIKEQRDLQIQSINEAAELNDKQQREITVNNITLQKLDIITEHLIELMELNTTRFNIVRRIVEYNNYNEQILNDKIQLFIQHTKLDKENLEDKEVKDFDEQLKVIKEKNMEYLGLTDELKEEETTYRLKIMALSAKVLSESLLVDLESTIEPFRKKQSEIVTDIYDQIIEYDNYLRLLRMQKNADSLPTQPSLNFDSIDSYSDDFRIMTNDLVREIKNNTREKLSSFLNPTSHWI
ncbi:hypothetical protein ACIQLG_16810 [Terribacillus saccharophilus]|uniref:hypothetical protein n=1 Tax=Terribacillus saccharophilus TaxID=361277 RepID=UPI0038041888